VNKEAKTVAICHMRYLTATFIGKLLRHHAGARLLNQEVLQVIQVTIISRSTLNILQNDIKYSQNYGFK
jgi:hypothetical protein